MCFLPVTVWLREARSAISALPSIGDRTNNSCGPDSRGQSTVGGRTVTAIANVGMSSGDGSVVRESDSWSKGRAFESQQERRENVSLLRG